MPQPTMAKRKPAEPVAEMPAGEYTVVARRYRPQQFADLVGQESVARALVNAIQSHRVAHAYLFTGARGVGKTSTARILAKALNCIEGPTATPCDKCPSCLAVAAGDDVDVLEIDGASNRRIEEVREIRQNVSFRPTRSRYKIYIIDEVHMLTREAFNALLKTLEEPPDFVKFIFATTDVQKIPITILSRCQRFDFGGIKSDLIMRQLRAVVAAEGRQADDEALELIARRAAGSMRDAQSLLDQLLAFGGDSLTAEQVHRLLGTAADDQVAALAAAVLAKDPQQALALLEQGLGEGLQTGELVDQLVEYWADLMRLASAGPDYPHLSAAPRLRETLRQQAAAVPLDSILAGLDVLTTTKARLRGSNHGRVLLEMALIRLGRLDDLVALAQLAQAFNQPEAAPSAGNAMRGASTAGAVRAVSQPPAVEVKKNSSAPTDAGPMPLTTETLPGVWSEVFAQVGHLHAAQLGKAGWPAITGPYALVLRFDVAYNHEWAFCSDAARVQRTQDVLRKVTGEPWTLRIETAVGRNGSATPPAATAERPQRAREVLQGPLLQQAKDVLGAKAIHVDEGFGSPLGPGPERGDPDLPDPEES